MLNGPGTSRRRHLSFQEALAAQVLAEETGPLGVKAWPCARTLPASFHVPNLPANLDTQKPQAAEQFKKIGGSLANFLNMPFYRNMLRIGAGPLGFSLLALFQYGSVH